MTLDRLWAGWRSEYVQSVGQVSADGASCVFCRLAAADPGEALVVAKTETTFSVMNAYPYISGHLMVVPIRHEAELDALSVDEANALMAMTRDAVTAVKRAYEPDGVNVGLNLGRAAGAGVPGHLHMHVLPRWSADTNFMTSVAEARLLPETLSASWEKLRSAWPVS